MNIEKKLYQWDTGQKLTGCTGLYVDFPIDNEVYRVETVDGMCIIPDELLQTSGGHKVWECMTNNTIRSFAFSVTPRPKPPDYVFTPTERLTFEGLVQKVDDAVADMIREVSSGAIGEFKSVVDKETETFNTNAETKLNAYNQNDSQKLNAYNTNAESKLTAYNENDVAKTEAYNTNASDKLDDYNTNASNKVTEYNSNAENKTAEFDTHTEQIQVDISELKSDLTEQDIRITTLEQSSTHKNIVVSPTSVFASANSAGSATSYNTFTKDSARIITFIEKRQYLIGSPFSRGDFLNLYVDDKNRLSLYIKLYDCKLENIVNGVVKNTVTLFTSSSDTIFNKIHYAISLLYRFDFNRNKFELYVYNGEVVENAFEHDLSEWDLSALVDFRLKTSFAWHSGHTATIFVSLNRYVDIEYYLTTPLEYSIQNTLVTQSAPTLTGFTPTALRLGGTITETISPTHKIANINQASESYFALGGTHPNFTKAKGTWIVTKFKCTNIEGFAIKCSTAVGAGMIVSEDGEILYVDGLSLINQYPNNRTMSFNPEEDVWYYYIALGQGTNSGDYLALYPVRVLGSCTIEAEALHISHCNENNLCCANYNGEYFTGSLAFIAENVAFDVVDPSKGNIAYPKYSIKADANGNIFMYNGTVWKQINVS